jgi:hypothetical protein
MLTTWEHMWTGVGVQGMLGKIPCSSAHSTEREATAQGMEESFRALPSLQAASLWFSSPTWAAECTHREVGGNGVQGPGAGFHEERIR